jgi:hypothetical protein
VIDDHRVVAWTPYGREVTVSVLKEYMIRDHFRGLVDEWWLCLNTDPGQVSDLRYAYRLAAEYDWIKAVNRPAGLPRRVPKQRNTGYFYRLMIDPGAVYHRFDDDIIYVHPDAIERLVRHKLATPDSLCSFATMWNNSIVSWFMQQAGVIPKEFGEVRQMFCMDPMGWANGAFAVKIHNLLLDWIEAGEPERAYLYQDFPIPPGTQYSVSCFASLGSHYAGLEPPGVLVPDEEESWHTVHRPRQIGQPNMLVGDALVSHYTFGPQRSAVLTTNILDRYRAIAEKSSQEA